MIRIASQRIFVEQCARIDLSGELYAKVRAVGARQSGWVTLHVTWPDGTAETLRVCLLGSPQRLGGRRRWLACPGCGRPCRVLLSEGPNRQWTCRSCLNAVYTGDYPGRRRWLAFRRFLGVVPGGYFELVTPFGR
jgi:hypothetical protein